MSNFNNTFWQRQHLADRLFEIDSRIDANNDNLRKLAQRARDANDFYQAHKILDLIEINLDEKKINNLRRLLLQA